MYVMLDVFININPKGNRKNTCTFNYSLYIVFHKLKWIVQGKIKHIFLNGVQITTI